MSSTYSGIYSFVRKELAPDEHAKFSLDFEVPFVFKGFVANPENSSGIVIEDILIGDQSVIVTGGVIPIEVFYADSWPLTFPDPIVPAGTLLSLRVHNTSKLPKLLQVAVFGDGLIEKSRETGLRLSE
jgi:hypothetical protein